MDQNLSVSVKLPWWIAPGFGLFALLIYAGTVVFVLYIGSDALKNIMVGSTIAMGMTVMNYYFGSSSGSQKKDDSMAVSAAKKDDTIAASSAALGNSAPVVPDKS
jgi:hypothetical protein